MSKKFIAPGGWFSLEYPTDFFEFEDEEGSFLFYNPNKWSGNLRVSASMDANNHYAKRALQEELQNFEGARKVQFGSWDCVTSIEHFTEKGQKYVCQTVVTGMTNMVVELSFTALEGASLAILPQVVQSLVINDDRKHFQLERIPVRIWEIHQINEAYEWVTKALKKQYKKVFTGEYQDIALLQQCIDDALYANGQRETWEAMGLTFGVILTNEMDGMEWVTTIRGNKEYPSLHFEGTDYYLDPLLLIWDKKRQGAACNLEEEFQRIKNEIESKL